MRFRNLQHFLAIAVALLATAAPRAQAVCHCPANVDVECSPVKASSFTYSNSADDTKDKFSLTLKGIRGPSSFNGLGDPSTHSACLCLYDNGSLVQLAEVPAGGTCGDKPCWSLKSDKSWNFKDSAGANDGVNKLSLSFKAADSTSGAKVKAKGVNVADLSLPLTGPVVVQLRSGLEYCAGAEAQVITQDPASGKLKLKQRLDGAYPACDDTIQNGYETGVDCGGPCAPCVTCSNGMQDGDEDGIDCGGSFCAACPTCSDGQQNGTETGIDCGGPCAACPTCSDGLQNGEEAGIDCGGPCTACPTCRDGIENGEETGVDCGGTCPICPTGSSKRIFIGPRYASWQMANQTMLDTHCTELAQAYEPAAGQFKAWTCTDASDDPDSRFNKYSDPYVRFSDGVVIASGGWNQLTSGTGLDNPVLKDEGGAVSLYNSIWTGTRTDGTCGPGATPEPLNCNGWTSELSTDQGAIGLSFSADTDLWNAWSGGNCDGYNPIYCVEQ